MASESKHDIPELPTRVRMPPGFKTVALNHKKKRSDQERRKRSADRNANHESRNHYSQKEYQSIKSDRSLSYKSQNNAEATMSNRSLSQKRREVEATTRPTPPIQTTAIEIYSGCKSQNDHAANMLETGSRFASQIKLPKKFIQVLRGILCAVAFSLALLPTILKIYESSFEESTDNTVTEFFARRSLPFQSQFGSSELLMKVYFFIVPYIASSFCLVLVHLLPSSNVSKPSLSIPTFCTKLAQGRILRRKLEFPNILTRIGAPDAVSVGEVIGVVVFLSFNLATLGMRVKTSLPRASEENVFLVEKADAGEQDISAFSWPALEVWGKALGAVAILNLGWYLLMPVSRKSVLLEALGLSWCRAIKYHRWVGFYSIIIMVLHGFFYFMVIIHGHGHPEYDPNGVMLKHNLLAWGCSDENECDDNQRLRLRTNLYGILALVLVLEMGIFALPYFRRYLYEWFYYVHHLFILVLFFVCLHHKAAIIYLIPGVAVYTIDKLMGLNAYLNCCLAKTKVVSSDVLECSFKIDNRNYNYKAGQYIFVNVPCVSHLQWHPFYVTSGPNVNPGRLFFHLKETGESEESWTRQVVAAGRAGQLEMRVDAFYGKYGKELGDKKAVVLVAAGIGISPMISLGMDLIHSQPNLPVTILWVCRTVQEFEIFSSSLQHAKHRSPNLTVKVWITLSRPEPRLSKGSVMSKETEQQKCDLLLSILKTPPLRKDRKMLFPSDEAKNHLFKTAPPGLESLGNAVSMTIAMVFALAGYGASVGIAREKGLQSQGMKSLIEMGIVVGLLIVVVVVLVLARPLLHSKVENETKDDDSETNHNGIFSDSQTIDNSIESGSRFIDNEMYRTMLEGRIGCRPDIQVEFNEIARIHKRESNDDVGTIGVLACGPKAITKAIRMAIHITGSFDAGKIESENGSDAVFTFVEEDWEI